MAGWADEQPCRLLLLPNKVGAIMFTSNILQPQKIWRTLPLRCGGQETFREEVVKAEHGSKWALLGI